MASIEQLKKEIDLHDLAEKLGLERPKGGGNYRSPNHDDKNPSLSIYKDGKRWKDFSNDEGGGCIDLVMYVREVEVAEAIRILHELYNYPMDTIHSPRSPQKVSREQHIAEKCYANADLSMAYLSSRAIPEETIKEAISKKAIGFNTWKSDRVPEGDFGHGGDAVAFVVRSLNPGQVVAVDMRYLNPDQNGGVKTQSHGEKTGHPWYLDLMKLKRAKTVYIVESAINALSIDACKMYYTTAIATRGTGTVEGIDWRFLVGKRVLICMDCDAPDKKNRRPGPEAGWKLYEALTGLNIAALLVDQGSWPEDEINDVNDIVMKGGVEALRIALAKTEPWIIPGLAGSSDQPGRSRIYLPSHDFAQYWRYRTKEDFVTRVSEIKDKETGETKIESKDVCGFRIASITRVTIQSATATMTGDRDQQPNKVFSASVQLPRHGPELQRRVFDDEQLHSADQWKKFGSIFFPLAFFRMVTILERSADLGARDAMNFVGIAWRDGRLVVNEGPDCYFTEPEKQCPYHNLSFPSGKTSDAKQVIEAYQNTFTENSATLALVWGLGAHLKTMLGFWPHMMMQADKGAGKSTLIKRLERTIGFMMFSRQTLNTEFRLLTSISHTSHPVGWEEISAGRQDVIDKAVAMLQECYQHTVTKRGSDMTEYLLCAPVLLAGEDVPVRSLLGKLVQTQLTGKKGPLMREDLPKFPVLQWLRFLVSFNRAQTKERHRKALEYCKKHSRASGKDDGASRIMENYAAILVAWGMLCDFCGMARDQGNFPMDLVAEMNSYINETSSDREPWVWVLEILLSEISAGRFMHPFLFDEIETQDHELVPCLIVRPSHVMDHIAHSAHLRGKADGIPIKQHRVFKRGLQNAGVIVNDNIERTISSKREGHMVALGLKRLQTYHLYASPPEEMAVDIDAS